MDAPSSQPKPHRGIYLLPNLLTTGAMFAGFYAIIAAIGGQYADAVSAVFVAALFDGLDGRVARLTNTQSAFGVQYDSLSDLVSFGVAPALVLYVWSLESLKEHGAAWGKLGWAAAFLASPWAAYVSGHTFVVDGANWQRRAMLTDLRLMTKELAEAVRGV